MKSSADTTNILNGREGKAQTRYPNGGSQMNTFAVYLSHAWEVNEHFVITDGIRYTNTSLTANFQDTTFFKFPFEICQKYVKYNNTCCENFRTYLQFDSISDSGPT